MERYWGSEDPKGTYQEEGKEKWGGGGRREGGGWGSLETWSRHLVSTFPLKAFVHFKSERKDAEKLINNFARYLLLGGQELEYIACQERRSLVNALVFGLIPQRPHLRKKM